MQKLTYYGLCLQQGFVQVGFLHPVSQRIHLLGAHCHGACYEQLVLVQDDLQVQLAAIVDAVYHHCKQVVQLEWDPAHPVPECDVGDTLHLLGDLFEEEVAVLAGHLG